MDEYRGEDIQNGSRCCRAAALPPVHLSSSVSQRGTTARRRRPKIRTRCPTMSYCAVLWYGGVTRCPVSLCRCAVSCPAGLGLGPPSSLWPTLYEVYIIWSLIGRSVACRVRVLRLRSCLCPSLARPRSATSAYLIRRPRSRATRPTRSLPRLSLSRACAGSPTHLPRTTSPACVSMCQRPGPPDHRATYRKCFTAHRVSKEEGQ